MGLKTFPYGRKINKVFIKLNLFKRPLLTMELNKLPIKYSKFIRVSRRSHFYFHKAKH